LSRCVAFSCLKTHEKLRAQTAKDGAILAVCVAGVIGQQEVKMSQSPKEERSNEEREAWPEGRAPTPEEFQAMLRRSRSLIERVDEQLSRGRETKEVGEE
jgi:ribosome-binding protein aMBF1 (putative translation factor)